MNGVKMAHTTRESWLTEAIENILPWVLAGADVETPTRVRVSVGWPGGKGKKGNTIGQCWHKSASSDDTWEIFVSPKLDDPVQILSVLTHELCHVADQNENGHTGRFKTLATAVGLTGKMTETTAGEELTERLRALSEELGPFPHAALAAAVGSGSTTHKQATRMLKLQAIKCCDYTVRTTRKWIDEGLPSCPHGIEMEEV